MKTGYIHTNLVRRLIKSDIADIAKSMHIYQLPVEKMVIYAMFVTMLYCFRVTLKVSEYEVGEIVPFAYFFITFYYQ